MQSTSDISSMIVAYNFVVGVLIMLASRQIAVFAGYASRTHRVSITRFTHTGTFTIGAFWALLSGFIYVVWHVFRIGL